MSQIKASIDVTANDQASPVIETVGRGMTRMGNASTNAGRSFAAQSKGLGGLVAAYAGAAATIFALQQTFSALEKAAQFEAISQGFENLARSYGENASSIISSTKQITQGQLALQDIMQNASLAVVSNISGAQFSQLTQIATKASVVLGRNLPDSITRLTRGVAKLEPELLDELGLFSRIEPAAERYALKLGKAASQLTNLEKRQAFANAVIDEGNLKFRDVDVSTGSAATALNQLLATLQDLATKIGAVFATLLEAPVKFIANSTSALTTVFTALSLLIFKKLGEVTKQGFDTFITNKAEGWAKAAIKQVDNVKAFQTGVQQTAEDAGKIARLEQLAKTNAGLVKSIKEYSKLSADTINLSNIDKQVANLTQAREALVNSMDARLARKNVKQPVLAPGETIYNAKDITKLGLSQANEKELRATREGLVLIDKSQEHLSSTATAAGDKAKAAADKYKGWTSALTTFGKVVDAVFSSLSRLLVIFTVASAVDSLLEAFTGFSILSTVFDFIGNAISSWVDTIKLGVVANNAFIASFGTLSTVISTRLRLTADEQLKAQTEINKGFSNIIKGAAASGQTTLSTEGPLNAGILMFGKNIEETQSSAKVFVSDLNLELQKQIDLLDDLARNAKSDSEMRVFAAARQQLVETTAAFGKFIEDSNISKESFNELGDVLTKVGGKSLNYQTFATLLKGGALTLQGDKLNFKPLVEGSSQFSTSLKELREKGLKELDKESLIAASAVISLNTSLISAGATSDSIQSNIQALTTQIEKLEKIGGADLKFINGLKELRDSASKTLNTVKAFENLNQILKTVFGSASAAVTQVEALGQVNAAGTISSGVIQEEGTRNQAQYLDRVLNATKNIGELEKNREQTTGRINELERIYVQSGQKFTEEQLTEYKQLTNSLKGVQGQLIAHQTAIQAMVSFTIQWSQYIDQALLTEKKRTLELNAQIGQLELQLELIKEQNAAKISDTTFAVTKDAYNLETQRITLVRQIGIANAEAGKAALERQAQQYDLQKQMLETQLAFRDAVRETAKAAIDIKFNIDRNAIQFIQDISSAFGNIFTDNQKILIDATAKATELQASLDKSRVELAGLKDTKNTQTEAADLERKNLELRLEAVKAEGGIIAQQKALDLEKATRDTALQQAEIEQRNKQLTSQIAIADRQYEIDVQRAESQKAIALLEIDLVQKRYEAIQAEGKILETHVVEIGKVFAKAQVLFEGQTAEGSDEQAKRLDLLTKSFTEGIQKQFQQAGTLSPGIDSARAKINGIADLQIKSALATRQVAVDTALIELEWNTKKMQQVKELGDLEQARIKAEAASKEIANKAAEDASNAELQRQKVRAATDLTVSENNIKLKEAEIALTEKQKQQTLLLAALQTNAYYQAANAVLGVVHDDFATGMKELDKALVEGTLTLKNFREGFRDWITKLGQDIQQAVFEKFVIQPAQDAINSGMKALFGAAGLDLFKDPAMKAADSIKGPKGSTNDDIVAAIKAGPQTSSTAPGTNPTADAAKKAQLDLGETAAVAGTTFASVLIATHSWSKAFKSTIVTTLLDVLSQIAKKASEYQFSNTSAPGGGGIGGFFSSLFGAGGTTAASSAASSGAGEAFAGSLAAGSFLAAGGPVRYMASGGHNALRDRIPAMLEPGEFVLRKNMVHKIGVNRLSQLNSNGNFNPNNVAVNITNTGTPQETRGKPKVDFDGEKAVVDIILRDMDNNGPIRRTLRGSL